VLRLILGPPAPLTNVPPPLTAITSSADDCMLTRTQCPTLVCVPTVPHQRRPVLISSPSFCPNSHSHLIISILLTRTQSPSPVPSPCCCQQCRANGGPSFSALVRVRIHSYYLAGTSQVTKR
jgi:hypothetical protein